MAARSKSKPFERLGSYILFKRLDTYALGEIWRAARIEGGSISPLVALHKLTGGDRDALAESAAAAAAFISQLGGATVVKSQRIELVDGIPLVSHEYGAGRSLRHIVDRARAAAPAPQPIPTDQAIGITERLTASLDYLSGMKIDGKRLTHGALIPHFVWIVEDGDVRVAGQQLAKGFLKSIEKNPGVARELGVWVAPEIRSGGEPTKASDVYSAGAIFFLLLTGQEPPDSTASLEGVLGTAKLAQGGEPLPPEIAAVLRRSLAPTPADRYPGAAEMHEAVAKLLEMGRYAPTTFNLAFYLHTLLRKEMEGEAVESEKESKVNLEPYLAELAPPAAVVIPIAAVAERSGPTFGTAIAEPKSKLPYVAGVTALAVVAGAIAFYIASGRQKNEQTAQSAPVPAVGKQAAIAPVMAAAPAATSTATEDPDVRKKALEEEINKKLQDELLKLQTDYNKQLQTQKQMVPTAAPPATAATTPVPKAVAAESTPPPSAERLDESRRPPVAARTETVAPVPVQPAAPQPTPAVTTAAAAAPPPAAPEIREGDLVASGELDQIPRIVRQVPPQYPPLAVRQRIEGTVLLSALINENGSVADVKVLRGDARKIGFDEAAIQAVRSFSFTPPMKNGKRVKTWFPVPFRFKL
jgi:TonB family protein